MLPEEGPEPFAAVRYLNAAMASPPSACIGAGSSESTPTVPNLQSDMACRGRDKLVHWPRGPEASGHMKAGRSDVNLGGI